MPALSKTATITALAIACALPAPAALAGDVLLIRRENTSGSQSGVPTEPVTSVPRLVPGYRVAWNDGRLNPFRATTSTLDSPRTVIVTEGPNPRLIDAETGQDVTALYPQVLQPFGAAPSTAGLRTLAKGTPVSVRASRRDNDATQPVADAPRGYLSVGVYGDERQAQAALRALRDAGLPFARRPVDVQGQKLSQILAGPFATRSEMAAATDAAGRLALPASVR